MNYPAASRGVAKRYRSIFAVKQRPPLRSGVLNPEVHNKILLIKNAFLKPV